jgi:5-methylcytosine-specific restriction endonuclease McrA
MENCYSCGVLFDETNNSLEHIINNSIGGRWRSKWLLCKDCNDKFGGSIDRVLDKQLGMITDYLMIS